MGANRRPVQRMQKLRDDVRNNVPKEKRIDKKDSVLNDSPKAYDWSRGTQRRQESKFGSDSMWRKSELAWEEDMNIERIDFGGVDFGLRVQISSGSIQDLARGLKEGDEVQILESGSALASQRYNVIEEANSGDVASGRIRLVNSTTMRLPEDAGWSDELGVRIRIRLSAGDR